MKEESIDNLRKAVERRKPLPLRVLFVCLGNICRSPAAEGILRQMAEESGMAECIEVDSCGTYSGHRGDLPDRRMRVHAIRRGYDLTHRARPVRERDFEDFDIIIGMDEANCDDLRRLAPLIEDERKVVQMIGFCRAYTAEDCVPDPYYEGAEGFEKVLDLLEDGCRTILDEVEKNMRGVSAPRTE